MHLITWSAAFALIGFVYCHILTDSGMILNGWFNFLDRKLGPGSAKNNGGKPRANWLFKPLGGCCRCVAGQAGFWGYFWYLYKYSANYDLVHHILFISFAIYLVKFIAQAYEWRT